jgi:hypothetical protein
LRLAELTLVPVEQVKFIWPLVSQWVRRSIERVDLSKFDCVEREVLNGDALLWVVHNGVINAAVITQLSINEGGKVCTIISCGGGGVIAALGLLERIEQYAKQEGCRSVLVYGRKGWARALKDYRPAAIVLRKELG